MCPRRVRKRSAFFSSDSHMYFLPPSSFLSSKSLSLHSVSFSHCLRGLASHSISLFPSSADPYNGGFLEDQESVLLIFILLLILLPLLTQLELL